LRALLCLALWATPAIAHEFWIDPQKFQVTPDEPIVADIRVGENFKGGAGAFVPQRFDRFTVFTGGTEVPVEGRIGDRPALTQTFGDGLAVIVHESTDSRLTYRQWSKFVNFVEHKDLRVLELHKERGLPETGFKESYRRYAKSLVAVGSGEGSDQVVGMRTELVALANPYTDDMTGGLPVRLLYEGAPRVDEQIEIYERAPTGEISVSTVRTNDAGEAVIPVKPGHVYQADAVKIIEGGTPNVAWHTMWANLTFAVPL